MIASTTKAHQPVRPTRPITPETRLRILGSTEKPVPVAVEPMSIPTTLRTERRWVLWAFIHEDGKWQKHPYRVITAASGKLRRKKARSNDPTTWMTFGEALQLLERHDKKFDGIGFVLGDGWIGVDVDNCRDPVSGRLSDEAQSVVENLGTYADVSPTGTGVKMIGRVTDPTLSLRVKPLSDSSGLDLSTYTSQYFTVTGRIVNGAAEDVADVSDALRDLCERHKKPTVRITPSTNTSGEHSDLIDYYRSVVNAARERCGEILVELTQMDWSHVGQRSKDRPCPYCDGHSRFWAVKADGGIDEHGLVCCRGTCNLARTLAERGKNSTRDIIDSVALLETITYREAANKIAEFLGMEQFEYSSGLDYSDIDKVNQDDADFERERASRDDEVQDTAQRHHTDDEQPGSPPDRHVATDRPTKRRPRLTLTPNRSLAITPTLEALGTLPRDASGVYQRNGKLVEIVGGEIVDLHIDQLAMRIDSVVQCQKTMKRGPVECETPVWLTKAIHTLGRYDGYIPTLNGIIATPTIRRDGTVLQTPGYDPSTSLYYAPSGSFGVVPDQPTKSDTQQAVARIRDVVCDCLFKSPVDFAAWLAMLITLVGRAAFTGKAPLFALTANCTGTGKGTSVGVTWTIAFGHDAPATPPVENDTEMRKFITACVREAAPVIFLDNVEGPLGGPALDAAITAGAWRDRELGASRSITRTIDAVFIANGNNLQYRTDTARRALPIRLHSDAEHPADREFRYPDILDHVQRNRESLVCDVLTILRAYFVDGTPPVELAPWGGFADWSRVIRGAIVWAGLPDPIETRSDLRGDDSSLTDLAAMIVGLATVDTEGVGLTAREIVERVTTTNDLSDNWKPLANVVSELFDRPDARKVARYLRTVRGRVVSLGDSAGDSAGDSGFSGAWRIEGTVTGRGSFTRWKPVRLDAGD